MLKRMKKQKSYINFFDKPEWEILVPEEYFGCYIVFIVVSMNCFKCMVFILHSLFTLKTLHTF